MSKPSAYQSILDLYKRDIDKGRINLYESMWRLMRKSPLLRVKTDTYTIEDVLSEAFLLADNIILRDDIDNKKKISKLWFLFNKGGNILYNKMTQYSPESYTIDERLEEEDIRAMLDDNILDWILVKNNIITPIEEKILTLMKQWYGKYDIARLMQTSYYNIKHTVDTLTLKIDRFIKENDINADYSQMNT